MTPFETIVAAAFFFLVFGGFGKSGGGFGIVFLIFGFSVLISFGGTLVSKTLDDAFVSEPTFILNETACGGSRSSPPMSKLEFGRAFRFDRFHSERRTRRGR